MKLSAVILTYNEEANLAACLKTLRAVDCGVFVVDSGSTDRTAEIARNHGVQVAMHPFESHAKQWNWALKNLPLSTDWVLCLDADQRLTPELRDELVQLFGRSREGRVPVVIVEGGANRLDAVDGFYLRRRQVFRGKWIRHGGYYPKYLLKLLRRECAWSDEGELADHRFYVTGRTSRLQGDLVEDNQNERDILAWARKHLVYADRQATEELSRARGGRDWNVKPSLLGTPDQRTLCLKRLWYRMPLYIRPFLYFFYRYILRLGFLDGKEGFIFHFLQGFWYRLLVDIRLDELRREGGVEPTATRSVSTGRDRGEGPGYSGSA